MWRAQALSTLMPFDPGENNKLHRNLQVVRVESSAAEKCVRTVWIAYLTDNQLKKKVKEEEQLTGDLMKEKEVAVQRLALIVPVEDLLED